MTSSTLTPADTSLSRVFIVEGRARPDHVPSYNSCLRMLGISQALGGVTKIECPDPDNYGKFVEIGRTRGAVERATTTLEGRLALDLRSQLVRLARKNCAIDVQLHFGQCTVPSDYTVFKKGIILEDVLLTNISTKDLGALASGDVAGIDESVEISAAYYYDVVPITYSEKASSIVTNEVVAMTMCDNIGCGSDCGAESDGCQVVIAVTKSAGGSPSTPADIVFTKNGGVTWYAYDINALTATQDPTDVFCVGSYVVVVSFNGGRLAYCLKSDLGITAPVFTAITTGLVGKPRAAKAIGGGAFIVGEQGYVYWLADPTAGVTVLDAGVATPNSLLDVDALSTSFAVAVGGNSTVIYTTNGTSWQAISGLAPSGIGVNYNAILCLSKSVWLIGASNGYVYYTLDGGLTWATSHFNGDGSGNVTKIVKTTDSVLYMAHTTTAPHGRIFRSYDGGERWVLTPENTGVLLANDKINDMAVCSIDPNLVYAGGLADNGTDGILMVGAGA